MVGVKVWTVRSMTLLLAKQPQFMMIKKITVARGGLSLLTDAVFPSHCGLNRKTYCGIILISSWFFDSRQMEMISWTLKLDFADSIGGD